jgi:hypothetical protein
MTEQPDQPPEIAQARHHLNDLQELSDTDCLRIPTLDRLLLIEEEEVRRYDGVRGWRRRGWVTEERRLLRVVDKRILNSPADMHAFIPTTLTEPFSVNDLATATNSSIVLARKMVYCLRAMGCVAPAGKRANAILYARRTT